MFSVSAKGNISGGHQEATNTSTMVYWTEPQAGNDEATFSYDDNCNRTFEDAPMNCRLYELLHHCYVISDARTEAVTVASLATKHGCDVK